MFYQKWCKKGRLAENKQVLHWVKPIANKLKEIGKKRRDAAD